MSVSKLQQFKIQNRSLIKFVKWFVMFCVCVLILAVLASWLDPIKDMFKELVYSVLGKSVWDGGMKVATKTQAFKHYESEKVKDYELQKAIRESGTDQLSDYLDKHFDKGAN